MGTVVKNRREILGEVRDCVESAEDSDSLADSLEALLDDYINNLENVVNEALDKLEDISSIHDLGNIADCEEKLSDLSQDLY